MIAIKVFDHAGSFAENKDIAAKIRESDLRPALTKGKKVQINFADVHGATQSFIHALVSDLIRKVGPSTLDHLEFKNCNPTVRSVIEIVVEYSQLAEPEAPSEADKEPPATPRSRRRSSLRRRRRR